jgi:hypothetical protein
MKEELFVNQLQKRMGALVDKKAPIHEKPG